jgi:hypothetical protein
VKWPGLFLLLLAAPFVQAQTQVQPQMDTVLVKRGIELREVPGDNARSLGHLAAQTPLSRLPERQGAWVQVRTAQGVTGWIHMFDIGASGGAKPSGTAGTAGGLGNLTSMFGRSNAPSHGTNLATSTVGIRGLGAEDIARAQPNLAAVGQVDAMRVDAAQAREFAASGGLNAYAVPPLPAPARPKPPAGQRGGPGNPQEAP